MRGMLDLENELKVADEFRHLPLHHKSTSENIVAKPLIF